MLIAACVMCTRSSREGARFGNRRERFQLSEFHRLFSVSEMVITWIKSFSFYYEMSLTIIQPGIRSNHLFATRVNCFK
jgi:hypothetical protein